MILNMHTYPTLESSTIIVYMEVKVYEIRLHIGSMAILDYAYMYVCACVYGCV